MDDLDTICDEECDDLCDDEVAACEAACGDNEDPDCVSECLDFNEVWGCY